MSAPNMRGLTLKCSTLHRDCGERARIAMKFGRMAGMNAAKDREEGERLLAAQNLIGKALRIMQGEASA